MGRGVSRGKTRDHRTLRRRIKIFLETLYVFLLLRSFIVLDKDRFTNCACMVLCV